ncbi:MAG TPA: hypothetical protein VGJ14_18665 [Sporichthyaceae bacterium]|jgi:hypothetical protein
MGTYLDTRATDFANASAHMSLNDLAELLFCSTLQPSQRVDASAVHSALAQALHSHHGLVVECAAELAASYGKDPEVTCLRMRWARDLISATYLAV